MNGRRWWAGRGPWLAGLLLCALGYYGSYLRSGINFRDEGGTVTLLAQRLLAGERPLVEVMLGYNVGWFYPVVGLFKLFGVNFVLLRGYCFFLSTVTAVMAFLAVGRAGGRPWLAFLTGALLVVVPGMTFKNYMPLMAVTNSACLLAYALSIPGRRMRWQALGGGLLGLTLLIRIDVGMFFSGLWLGALALRALQERRALPAVRGVALLSAGVLLLHLPVWLDARRRSFDEPFLKQYSDWPRNLALQLTDRLRSTPPPVARPVPEPPALLAPAPAKPELPAVAPVDQSTLARLTWADWARRKNPDERMLLLLIYAPLLTIGLLGAWSAGALLRHGRAPGEPEAFSRALGAALLLGGALTVFPQYFFFRPDAPHLAEFSPGYWLAVVGALLLLTRGRPFRGAGLLVALLLAAHAGLFLVRLLPDRWAGTIAARRGRTVWFEGENGVRVYVTRVEFRNLTEIRRLIRDHTERSDYLVAWPYEPAFNVLADRRTYERSVYVDNATAEPRWNEGAIRRLERRRPAVVILSDWAVNGTAASRFSVWAAPTQKWLQEHYDDQGKYLDFEVYTRR